MNPLLSYINDLLSFFSVKPIVTPTQYRDKVLQVKQILREDFSGLVNTVLDFAINSASLSYRVDSSNENLEKELNDWIDNINSEYRGKIPTGLESLAKEYFRERWKGSSHILLRTIWANRSGLNLPIAMWFVDGEDIIVKNEDTKALVIGEEKYYLRVSDNPDEDVSLPNTKEEKIYVQRPFDAWGIFEPTPWLIRKGIWHNMKAMELMINKAEFIVAKALEYLLLIKKGSERLTIDGNVSYSQEDYQKISDEFKTLIDRKKSEEGLPTYTTGFDTQFEQFIPDYQKVMSEALYAPIEKKLLAGLGLIDIIQGTASTRKESILNPRPLVSEVNQGIKDFKLLLKDIIKDIVERNKTSRRKWMSEDVDIATMPVSDFLTNESKTLMRSMYDRGLLSKRTATEVLGEVDYDVEVQRRITEEENEDDDTMYPPVVTNMEQYPDPGEGNPIPGQPGVNAPEAEDLTPDKKGPEAKNYDKAKIRKRKVAKS